MAPAAIPFQNSVSIMSAREGGWQPVPYRTGDRCPTCGKSNFYMRRVTAECAGCGTALPIEQGRPDRSQQ